MEQGLIKDNRRQIQYLDTLRIAATLFVILLHSLGAVLTSAAFFGSRTWWLCNILNSVSRTGVPLFFMMSGYLLLSSPKTLDFTAFYKKRFAHILPVFLLWDAIYFVLGGLVSGEKGVLDFFKELLNNGSSYHLWFVYTLAGVYLIAPFIKRVTDNCSPKQLIWFLIIIMFPSTIRPFINTVTPLYIFLFNPLLEGYLGYFVLGYILGKSDIPKKLRTLICLGGLVGAAISVFGNYLFSSGGQIDLYFNGGYQLNHFLLASSIFVFAKQLKPIGGKAAGFIASISGATYTMYLSHVLVLSFMNRYVTVSTPMLRVILSFTAAAVISLIVALFLVKIKQITHSVIARR